MAAKFAANVKMFLAKNPSRKSLMISICYWYAKVSVDCENDIPNCPWYYAVSQGSTESKNICHMIPHLMLDAIFRWKWFYEISFVSQQVCQAFSWRQCMWFVWNRTHSQRSLQVKDQQSQSFCNNFVLLFKSQKYQKIGILGFGKRLVDWCVVFLA